MITRTDVSKLGRLPKWAEARIKDLETMVIKGEENRKILETKTAEDECAGQKFPGLYFRKVGFRDESILLPRWSEIVFYPNDNPDDFISVSLKSEMCRGNEVEIRSSRGLQIFPSSTNCFYANVEKK